MNFGTMLNSVTKSCVTMIFESRDVESRKLAKDFVNFINLKVALKKQFRVYNQLNGSFIRDKDSANLFVNETLSILDGINFDDIVSYNHLLETKFNIPKIETNKINLAISKLIKYKTSQEKFGQIEYIDAFNQVVEHLTTVRKENSVLSELNDTLSNSELKFLNPKHIVKIAIKKFNETYSPRFTNEDREMFAILNSENKTKINEKWKELTNEFETLRNQTRDILDEDIRKNLDRAHSEVCKKYSTSNMLDIYDLVSELKLIRKETK